MGLNKDGITVLNVYGIRVFSFCVYMCCSYDLLLLEPLFKMSKNLLDFPVNFIIKIKNYSFKWLIDLNDTSIYFGSFYYPKARESPM